MKRCLARASIYASPARYEPFGLSVLEAALSHCALVLGDIPSLREIWSDAAVFVEPDNENALSAALNRLIEETADRREMAHRAYAHALQYSSARMAGSYMRAYAELLSQEAVTAKGRGLSSFPATLRSSEENSNPFGAATKAANSSPLVRPLHVIRIC
jgi:glycogen synthase